ncbi:MAG: type III-B CRISPR module-associated protein Cmr5 [Anaerolineaceae bacterium]|nr:type III-B CRISPR module-associated protein Cmr5 [Anaerolineaceae bacterium]
MSDIPMSKRRTLEQERAKGAWDNIKAVEDVQKDQEKVRKKYGTFARRLPSMIQINGLGSTLAFLQSKGKNNQGDGHTLLYDHVGRWVTQRMTGDSQDIMNYIRDCTTDQYRRATAEAVAYGIWIKRYVESKADAWGLKENED